MYIFLPNKRDGLDELIAKIDGSTLQRIQLQMRKTKLMVKIPKFEFTNTLQLNEILKKVSFLVIVFKNTY